MSKPRDRKAAQKQSAETDSMDYEDTPFGRRRIGKISRILTTLFGVGTSPITLIYQRLKRSQRA